MKLSIDVVLGALSLLSFKIVNGRRTLHDVCSFFSDGMSSLGTAEVASTVGAGSTARVEIGSTGAVAGSRCCTLAGEQERSKTSGERGRSKTFGEQVRNKSFGERVDSKTIGEQCRWAWEPSKLAEA